MWSDRYDRAYGINSSSLIGSRGKVPGLRCMSRVRTGLHLPCRHDCERYISNFQAGLRPDVIHSAEGSPGHFANITARSRLQCLLLHVIKAYSKTTRILQMESGTVIFQSNLRRCTIINPSRVNQRVIALLSNCRLRRPAIKSQLIIFAS